MTMDAIDRQRISETETLIRPYIRRTPVITIDGRELGLDALPLTLKLELLQHSGSFKARGAFASLCLTPIPAAGIAAASGGNHGAAVAYAAHMLGAKARIFVPTISSPTKIKRIADYGAELTVTGDAYADALAASDAYIATSGARSVHAYDQPETVLGQGTVALEFEAQAPDLDTVLVAVGGGGLLAGVASWYGGRTKVVGVEPETSCALHAALAAGAPVDVTVSGVAADSLGAKRVGTIAFDVAGRHVDHVALVPDAAIKAAQELLWDRLRIVAEPGGAAALAALTSGRYRPRPGERVGVLVCGGNTTAVDFNR